MTATLPPRDPGPVPIQDIASCVDPRDWANNLSDVAPETVGRLRAQTHVAEDPNLNGGRYVNAKIWLDDGDAQPLLPPPALWPTYFRDEADEGGASHLPATPREMIAQTHLLSAVPARIKRRLAAGDAIVVVIKAASPDWSEALAHAAKTIWRTFVVVGEKGRLNKSKTPHTDAPIVAIASDLTTLSQTVVAAADCTIAVRPDARAVALAIELVCGARAHVRPSDVAGLDPDDLAFAIRRGMAPKACVVRLRRLTARGGAVSAASVDDRAPGLDQLVGYGAALAEVRAIAADVAQVKAGALAASELPSFLLYGPPGTGKTTLVRSFARSTGLPLVQTSVSAWFHSGDGALGGVAKNYKKFFDQALAAAPCVAFLDELDALPDRAALDARGRDWWSPIVTGVLLMIDETRAAAAGVVLCAATNHLQLIDAALKRPGRFDRLIEILGPQTPEELAEVLRHHLGKDLRDVDLVSLAQLGRDGTGAMAEGWVRAARQTARNADRPMVPADLAAAIAPADDRTSAKLRLAALHEAGHAVVGRALGLKVPHVTIVGRDGTGGSTTFEGLDGVRNRADIERRVTTMLAGRASDEAFGGGANTGAAVDLSRASELLASIHVVFGLGDQLLSLGPDAPVGKALTLDDALRASVESDLRRLMEESRKLVARHARAIQALADLLFERRVASAAEIDRVLSACGSEPPTPVRAAAPPDKTEPAEDADAPSPRRL